MATLPYQGLRVIDFTDVWAGPIAASFLGDLGADVVHVESYPRPGILRPIATVPGMSGFVDDDPLAQPTWERAVRYYVSNRNKRGIALNIKEPRGVEVLRRLAQRADIFLESYASGVLTKLGFGWEVLSQLNPKLILISMSAWGHGGPYHGYRAMGSGIDATVGHPYLRGYADSDVSATVQAYQSDAAAAATALFAAGVALWQRRRTGKGAWVDIAQAETLLAHMPGPFLEMALGAPLTGALENRHPLFAPYGCYRCAGEDSWIQVCVRTQEEWLAAAPVLDQALLAEPRFATPVSRLRHRAELDAAVGAATVLRGNVELMEALQGAGVPAGAVYTNEQVAADRQLRQRGFLRTRDHPVAGLRLFPGYAWRFDDGTEPEFRPANTLGEHNDEVLRELGYDATEIASLNEGGVVASSFAAAQVENG